jgi:hypothetical protein
MSHSHSFDDIKDLLREVVYHPKLGKVDAQQILRKAGGVDTLMDCPTSRYQDVADDCHIILALASGKVIGRLVPETRDAAYDAIDTERDFQNVEHPQPTSLPGQMLILEKLIADAKYHWYYDKNNDDVIHHMRKIAAFAVHVMEIHGAPPREE